MNFETAFAHYQDNTATAEEEALVRQELEKYRLIEDYMADRELPELPAQDAAQAAAETKAVKRRLNRRTRNVILITAAAVLAIVMLLQFLVSPLINRTVYDDTWLGAGYSDTDYRAFDVAMSALAGLYMPLGDYIGSTSEHSGFMTDTLQLSFYDFTGNHRFNLSTDVSLRLGRVSRLSFSDLHAIGYASGGYFYDYDHDRADGSSVDAGGSKIGRTSLEALPDYLCMTTAMSFTRKLTVDELADLMARYPEVSFLSANVWADGASVAGMLYCSLLPMSCGYGSKLEEEYPGLQFRKASYPDTESLETGDAVTGADIQQHFEAMLQYLIDHPKAARAGMDEPYRYKLMLRNVREQGLDVNGVWVQGTPSQLLAMLDDECIRSAGNYDARIDLYIGR